VSENDARGLMPWAWGAAWLLTAVGAVVSDIYSRPPQGPAGYLILGAIGWAVAALVTASAVRNAGRGAFALAGVGWVLGYMTAVPAGFGLIVAGSFSGAGAYWGPVVCIGTAGLIGGLFTSADSGGTLARVARAAVWGLAFLVLSTTAFFASYFLIFSYALVSPLLGPATGPFIWGVPAGLAGVVAGWVGRRLVSGTGSAQKAPRTPAPR
jgi:hypothetical protein